MNDPFQVLGVSSSATEDEIKAAYEEGKNLANSFYDDLTTYEADEIMRQFIARGKDITISKIPVNCFIKSVFSFFERRTVYLTTLKTA